MVMLLRRHIFGENQLRNVSFILSCNGIPRNNDKSLKLKKKQLQRDCQKSIQISTINDFLAPFSTNKSKFLIRSKLSSEFHQHKIPSCQIKICLFDQKLNCRFFSIFNSPVKRNLPDSSTNQDTSKPKKINDNVQFTWRQAIFTSIVCGILIAYWTIEKNKADKMRIAKISESTLGKPLLHCDWVLFNQDGELMSNVDFKGRYLLIYFGFSFCPDICPQELEKQISVIEKLNHKFGDIVQPIFITVDPRRDTVAQLKSYGMKFHPRLLCFTGTSDQIKKVTRGFRVYYNPGIKNEDENYLVDHSIIQYLIGPNGKFRDFYSKNYSSNQIFEKISLEIQSDLDKRKKKINFNEDDDDDGMKA